MTIVRREDLKETLGKILEMHEGQSADSTSENEKASYINKDEFSPKSDVAHAGINRTSQPGNVSSFHERQTVRPAVII